MKIVSTSYNKVFEYKDPYVWLRRISFYTGILERLSANNEVISIDQIDYEGSLLQNGVHYYFARQKRKTSVFPFKKHSFIKKSKPDLVIINGFVYPLQVIQLRLSIGKRTKIMILHRAEKPFKDWRKYLQKLADKCVDAYVFTSLEFGEEWVRAGIIGSEKKIHEVIQASSSFRPQDKNAARAELNINGCPVFLWVGRLDANKDPVTVVKGFLQLLAFLPEAKLYMIYQTTELLDEIKGLINSKDGIKNIRLIGPVAHQQMQAWYNSADFIISGSHYEGSGIAVSEAMSCGCIPIVTDIISFRKMTGPGKCGLLYDAGNDKKLLSALLQAINMDIDKEKGRTMRQFNDELSFEAIAQKIEKVITSL